MNRQTVKTREQRFIHTLKNEFEFSVRVAEAILSEAQAQLWGAAGRVGVGQQRVLLTDKTAGHGRSLSETRQVEVVWTVNGGKADMEILSSQGRVALRRVRIQRLLDEALEQGGVASQEDLAQALQVTLRTIQRDFAALKRQGVWLPGRGNLKGIGRGQTHKALILRRWLQGESYDQLVVRTHHQLSSIQRYVQTFVRVIELQRQGFDVVQTAQLVQIGQALVEEYLAVWRDNDTPACRQRLEEQLQRFAQGKGQQKRGAGCLGKPI